MTTRIQARKTHQAMCRLLSGIGLLLAVIVMAQNAHAAKPLAIQLNAAGAISPATQDYIVRGLNEAQARHASVVILQLDTPGGLDSSTRGIIQAILASDVPVVT